MAKKQRIDWLMAKEAKTRAEEDGRTEQQQDVGQNGQASDGWGGEEDNLRN
jgi:hypothetical protein